MKSTLLELFAINDQEPPDIGSDLVKIVEIPDGETKNGKKKHMSHWLQHVYLLGTQKRITFDLLFIDIRFMPPYEAYAPKYGTGTDNPMGLLHALTFASRQDPGRAPLVWGYHSAEPEKVCNDPIAIVAFSLLAAMEQRGAAGDIFIGRDGWKWDDFGIGRYPKKAVQHFSDAIANLPQGTAEVIWKDMIQRYRNKLLHYVKNGLAFIEYDDLESAYHLSCSNTPESRERLAKISLRIYGKSEHSWSRVLLLQSLFANELVDWQESWPEDKVECLNRYVLQLRAAGGSERPEKWAEKVAKVMVGGKTAVLNGIRPKQEKSRIGSMAILCWWLEQKAHHKLNVTTEQLLRFFGYHENRKPLTNCLSNVAGFDSLEKFLVYLEKTETPLQSPLLYDVGQYWWLNKCKSSLDRAPKCIQ